MFIKTVWEYYHAKKRDLPWRLSESNGSFDAYKIFVSELMLQQTQVARVIPKYEAFLSQFPDVQTLAKSSLGDVLRLWQGLGYNRRAKFLWQASAQVVTDFGGDFPHTQKELVSLPGIGVNTAGAIMAYAWNKPVVYIETNIRTVIIHHFFHDEVQVTDKQIQAILEQTIKQVDNYREFYWALMDYGSHLKSTVGNKSRNSKAYTKQSPFQGSLRQIRGQVLRELASSSRSVDALGFRVTDSRLGQVLIDLKQEGLIIKEGSQYKLG